MNFKLLLVSFFLISFNLTQAQESNILYNDDNFRRPWEWTIYDLNDDGFSWYIEQPNDYALAMGYTGNVFVSNSSMTDVGPLRPDNLLVSPVIALPDTGDIELTYKIGGMDLNFFAETYSVYILVASELDNVNGNEEIKRFIDSHWSLWTTVVEFPRPTVQKLSLEDFKGKEIQLAFRHHYSYNTFKLALKDVVVTQRTLSVKEVLENQFTVFPNPTNGVLSFSNTANVLVSKIDVVDINGRRVQSFDFNLELTATIDVSSLQSGVYFLNIDTNQGRLVKKIIKK